MIGRATAALLAVGAVLVGAGCGDGGKTLTKEEYVNKLGRLCLVSDDKVHELHMDLTVADWKADGGDVLSIDRKFLDGMDALKPPHEIADLARRYGEKVQAATDHTSDAVASAKKRDATAMKASLAKADKDYEESSPIAKEMGAKGCFFQ